MPDPAQDPEEQRPDLPPGWPPEWLADWPDPQIEGLSDPVEVNFPDLPTDPVPVSHGHGEPTPEAVGGLSAVGVPFSSSVPYNRPYATPGGSAAASGQTGKYTLFTQTPQHPGRGQASATIQADFAPIHDRELQIRPYITGRIRVDKNTPGAGPSVQLRAWVQARYWLAPGGMSTLTQLPGSSISYSLFPWNPVPLSSGPGDWYKPETSSTTHSLNRGFNTRWFPLPHEPSAYRYSLSVGLILLVDGSSQELSAAVTAQLVWVPFETRP